MSSIIIPVCKCGNEYQVLYIGTGMESHETECRFPAPCFNCKSIVEANIFKEKKRCRCNKRVEPYGEYDPDECIEYPIVWEYIKGVMFVLDNKKYICPNCLEEELTFEKIGFCD